MPWWCLQNVEGGRGRDGTEQGEEERIGSVQENRPCNYPPVIVSTSKLSLADGSAVLPLRSSSTSTNSMEKVRQPLSCGRQIATSHCLCLTVPLLPP